jgi:hypothetical protein
MRCTVNAALLASAGHLHLRVNIPQMYSCESQRREALPGQHYAVGELHYNVDHDGNGSMADLLPTQPWPRAERTESSGPSNRLYGGISQLAQSTVDQAAGQWQRKAKDSSCSEVWCTLHGPLAPL